MSNEEVYRRVLGVDSRPPTEIIAPQHYRWFRYVLRRSAYRLPFCAIFARNGYVGPQKYDLSGSFQVYPLSLSHFPNIIVPFSSANMD